MSDGQFCECFSNSDLKVPIKLDNEVSFTNKFSLIATMNHCDSFK